MRQVARRLQSLNKRVFNRVTRQEIRQALERLGLAPGDIVFAHVSMRSLGYVPGGPQEVVAAILDVLGEKGSLMMSAWPSPNAAPPSGMDLFDLVETPSSSGAVSEALRHHPASRRSLHPVASVVVAGQGAADLVAGHELSTRPFGPGSPYAKLASMGPRLLLIGAHIGGLLYHVQDKVEFPNLYARDHREFDVRDEKGSYRKISTQVLRPEVPPVVILPGSRPENRDYVLIPDYALMFPPLREQEVLEAGYLRFNRSRFLGRRERLRGRSILTMGQVGSAESALLDGTRMLGQVEKDLEWDLARFKQEYDAEHLSLLSLPVF